MRLVAVEFGIVAEDAGAEGEAAVAAEIAGKLRERGDGQSCAWEADARARAGEECSVMALSSLIVAWRYRATVALMDLRAHQHRGDGGPLFVCAEAQWGRRRSSAPPPADPLERALRA